MTEWAIDRQDGSGVWTEHRAWAKNKTACGAILRRSNTRPPEGSRRCLNCYHPRRMACPAPTAST